VDFSGISIADGVVAFTLSVIVVLPILALVHELGHALAALSVSSGDAEIHVGRPVAPLRFRLGRIRVNFSLVPPQGFPFTGSCVYQRASRSPLRELVFLLAGPIISLLVAALLAGLAVLLMHSEPQWLALTFTCGSLQGLAAFLYNVDPRRATKSEKERLTLRRDGPRARHCYRLWRAGGVLPSTSHEAAPVSREPVSGESSA
jgi:hypothetical protein